MKRILKIIGLLLAVLVVCFLILLLVLTITEYRPADLETLKITGDVDDAVQKGQTLDVLCWNIGFGALGDNADFFMDGGTMVKPSTKQRVQENLVAMADYITSEDPDMILLQEVDEKSTHSYYIDEASFLADQFRAAGNRYEYSMAYNYKTLFVPYPLPPIGREQAGQVTYSKYDLSEATRVALPCPFAYPIRLANLKRCLSVSRTKVDGTGRELVIVNLHLEAYDDGKGKAAQTKLLSDFLQKEAEAGNYVLAGGDFNQTFDTVDLSKYPLQREDLWKSGVIAATDFSDDFQILQDDRTPSCRSLDRAYDPNDPEFQYYVLDGFILSNNLKVESFETVDLGFENTDHNPLRLKVTLE